MTPATARSASWVPQAPIWLRSRARTMLQAVWMRWAPPERMTTREWADRYLYLSPETGTARPGEYSSSITPWLHEIQDAVDDPRVHKVVCMKSSQIGWTMGVIVAHIGKRIDIDPCAMVVMFPTLDAAREFNDEKLMPTVSVTPRLRERIDTRSRKAGNRSTFKHFVGGFLKLVGSNSPRSVKSSSAPLLIVEEPDDASQDVKGQGDSIRLLEDRAKTHGRYKIIYGGTPTLKGLSAIDWAYANSDQRKLFVACHHCNEEHVLEWANVHWDEDPAQRHEIYGDAKPDTARYACPHCGVIWNDYEKNQNVLRATQRRRWIATAPFNGVAGFGHLSELYVNWPKSTLANFARRYLQAKHKAEQGDDSELITFYNSTLGLAYEYGGESLDADALREALSADYAEGTVPQGGLLLTAGIDIQHDRFAIVVRAWGIGEESWLVYFGEIYSRSGVNDRSDPVWQELEQKIFGSYTHANGREMFVSGLTIDCSDGTTSDAAYDWVRAMIRKYRSVQTMAGKGASDNADREIFSLPKASVDNRTPTKAMKYGLRVYLVGTNKAKDLLLGDSHRRGRVHLTGIGPGRFHVYTGVRADYWDQLTSEVKAPARRLRGKMTWQVRSGRRNEGLDCENYSLHAARALRTHVMTPAQWAALEHRAMQRDLFTPPAPPAPALGAAPKPKPSASGDNDAGFGREDWVL